MSSPRLRTCCSLLCGLLLSLGYASLSANEQPIDTLLKRSQAIQMAASDLLTELYLTEHSILFPQHDLVVIMFSQIQGARIFLHQAEVFINDELVETYRFPMLKVEQLAHRRAIQPLFSTLLPAGEHSIRVRIHGLQLGGNNIVETEKIIQKAGKPMFLQLNNGFREIEVTEW